MIIFVFGEDTEGVRRKKNELVSSFQQKYEGAGNNIDRFSDFSEEKISVIGSAVKSPPFLCEKRLILLEDICSNCKKAEAQKLLDHFENLPETSFIIFSDVVSEKKMKKNHFYKTKIAEDDVYEHIFGELNETEFGKMIINEAEALGMTLNDQIARCILRRVGNDASLLVNELRKLAAYTQGRSCTLVDVEEITSRSGDDAMFTLMDAISAKDKRRALSLIESQRMAGSDDFYILSMLFRQVRILLSVLDSQEKLGSNKSEIARATGLHPFVVQKTMAQLRGFSKEELKKAHKICFTLDGMIKNGKVTAREAVDLILARLMH